MLSSSNACSRRPSSISGLTNDSRRDRQEKDHGIDLAGQLIVERPNPRAGVVPDWSTVSGSRHASLQMTTLRFTKMHGIGNDFVVLDGINQQVALTPELARRIADRHFGIGCDQILLVETPASEDADFRYRIWNADGGEV